MMSLVLCPAQGWETNTNKLAEDKGCKEAGNEAKQITKYAELARTHHVTPLAIETSEVFAAEDHEFFDELGRWMIQITGDLLTKWHMTQQISVALQRGNATSVLDSIDQSTPFDSQLNSTHSQVVP